ncbi:MAG: AbrB/MazE/SpoVT family DNA-binding domain-containing protein [Bifidobacteriaceae bacterium]|jgi:AbrB family looped-hinge helix DNA binding protein|nr:AbrB/MazE/SpoVT family DNA-binding domain-containing protein [Bifidobacteriaceae bacterium]
MPSSTVTSKGQLTVPAEIRRQFGIEPGTRVDFYPVPGGTITMIPRTQSAADLAGMLGPTDVRLTVEEMNEAIADAAAHRVR